VEDHIPKVCRRTFYAVQVIEGSPPRRRSLFPLPSNSPHTRWSFFAAPYVFPYLSDLSFFIFKPNLPSTPIFPLNSWCAVHKIARRHARLIINVYLILLRFVYIGEAKPDFHVSDSLRSFKELFISKWYIVQLSGILSLLSRLMRIDYIPHRGLRLINFLLFCPLSVADPPLLSSLPILVVVRAPFKTRPIFQLNPDFFPAAFVFPLYFYSAFPEISPCASQPFQVIKIFFPPQLIPFERRCPSTSIEASSPPPPPPSSLSFEVIGYVRLPPPLFEIPGQIFD